MLLDNRWLLTSDGSAVANHAAEVARNATSQATVAFRTVRVHSGVPVHAGTDADDANIATISLQGIPGTRRMSTELVSSCSAGAPDLAGSHCHWVVRLKQCCGAIRASVS